MLLKSKHVSFLLDIQAKPASVGCELELRIELEPLRSGLSFGYNFCSLVAMLAVAAVAGTNLVVVRVELATPAALLSSLVRIRVGLSRCGEIKVRVTVGVRDKVIRVMRVAGI